MTIPLRFRPEDDFALVRSFLKQCEYSESAICRRENVTSQAQLLLRPPKNPPPKPGDALDLLISVFLLGQFASREDVEALVPPSVLAAFQSLGLLEKDGDVCCAAAALYPVRNIFIVSDRWNNPDGKPLEAQPDIVYPANTPNTLRLLRYLPEDPAGAVLEACCGTGVAALLAATRYAGRAWAADIAHRSTEFARFNCRLNGVDNVEVLEGDLYEPVRGLQFDRIIAHPPYVPAVKPKYVFQDAGEGGEFVTRRLIEGLPEFLAPGGRFYCLTLGFDRAGEDYETRIRRWLGPKESEFDVLVAVVERRSPTELAADFLLKGLIRYAEFVERQKAFEEAADEFLYSFLVIQRVASPRPVFTVRRMMSPKTGAAQVEWLRRVQTALMSPETAPKPALMRPRAAQPVELSGSYMLRDGRIETTSFTAQVDYPLYGMLGVEPWVGNLLALCDGSETGRDLYLRCRREKWLAPEVGAEEFYRLLLALLTGGFIEVEGFTLPAAEG